MLGQFNGAASEGEDHHPEEGSSSQEASSQYHSYPNNDLTEILIECARAASHGQWQTCINLINILSQRASSHGDSHERLVSHFSDSLAAHVICTLGDTQPLTTQLAHRLLVPQLTTFDNEASHAAYLAFNQITPFIRFSHLTANQAILEALEGWDMVHIVDLEIMQGVQWPPLLQALAERPGGPPRIRMSGVAPNMALLEQTGDRLRRFAASLGLPFFEFLPLHAGTIERMTSSTVDSRPGEALAINCILQLHHLWHDKASLLSYLQSLQPQVITILDRETDYNQPIFIDRFLDAFKHYSGLFDSLEATLPPSSMERSSVESVWFKQEIVSLLDSNQGNLLENQYSKWRDLLRDEGFNPVPHSAFALSQARLLLRLHYPSEGYQLSEDQENCLILGWQGRPLFAVSVWN